jgi:hypothetical protein
VGSLVIVVGKVAAGVQGRSVRSGS